MPRLGKKGGDPLVEKTPEEYFKEVTTLITRGKTPSDFEKLKEIIPSKLSPDGIPGKSSLLFTTAQRESPEYLKQFLDSGANPNALGPSSKIPFVIFAVSVGKLPIVRTVIHAPGIDLSVTGTPSTGENNILHICVDRSAESPEWVDIFKEAYAKYPANINKKNSTGSTPFMSAALLNRLNILQFLLTIEDQIDVNVKDKAGQTALFYPIIGNDPKFSTFEQLVKFKSIDYKVKFQGAYTVLLLAIENTQTPNPERIKMIELLIQKEPELLKIEDPDGDTPLHKAIKFKNPSAQLFLEKDSSFVNRPNVHGTAPLHLAAYSGILTIAKLLLEKGAKKNVKDFRGKTPQDYANVPEMKELLNLEEASPPPSQPYKGYTKNDADLFNQMFTEPNEWSCCPVCLSQVRRSDGCMYMKHTCEKQDRHEDLFQKFKDTRYNPIGQIEWCTICGRITLGHKHQEHSIAKSSTMPAFAEILPTAVEGVDRHFDKDCKKVGGGGFEEKVRRVHRLLNQACELQDEVGKVPATQARNELIEEVWNSGDVRNRKVSSIISNKKFEFPCTFPEDAKPEAVAPQADAPDIPRPMDQKDLTPIEHVAPDNDCVVELGSHDDGRPVYEFRHKQVDGTIVNHAKICAEDLEQVIRSQPITGRCVIEPDKCKALLYPEELQDIAKPEFQETYRKLFNQSNKVGGGSGSILKPLDLNTATCAPPQKKAGRRRKTRRAKKGGRRRKTVKA